MPAFLTFKGVSTTWAEFCKLPNYKKILYNLTITEYMPSNLKFREPGKYYLFYKYRDRIMIARFAGLKLFPDIKNALRPANDVIISNKKLILKPHQKTIKDYLLHNVYNKENIDKGSAGCVLQLDTGMGKTFLAIGLSLHFRVKTLIIVPNKAILGQWVKAFNNSCDNKIGEYHSQKKQDGDFVIMIARSASKKTFKDKSPIDYFSQFGFIIFDEIHTYPTPDIGKMFWNTCSHRVLGLTASPNSRKDRYDRVYFEHVGPLINGKDIPGCSMKKIEFNVNIIKIKYKGSSEHTKKLINKNGMSSCPLMVKQFSNDPDRNKLIINLIKYCVNNGRGVYLLSERRDHLEYFANELKSQDFDVNAPEIFNIMGGSTNKELELAKESANILLTTYSYGRMGISIDHMDTLILATPRVSYMDQITGRIKRLGGDTDVVRVVIDIVDQNTKLVNQSYKRNTAFHNEGYNVLDPIVINYNGDECSDNFTKFMFL